MKKLLTFILLALSFYVKADWKARLTDSTAIFYWKTDTFFIKMMGDTIILTGTDSIYIEKFLNKVLYSDTSDFAWNASLWKGLDTTYFIRKLDTGTVVPGQGQFIDSLGGHRTDLLRKDALGDSITSNKLIDSTLLSDSLALKLDKTAFKDSSIQFKTDSQLVTLPQLVDSLATIEADSAAYADSAGYADTADYASSAAGWTLDNDSLTSQSGVNVGIGTNAPLAPLHLYTASGDYPFIFESGVSNSGFKFRYSGTDMAGIRLTGETNGGLDFYTNGVTSGAKLRITDDGEFWWNRQNASGYDFRIDGDVNDYLFNVQCDAEEVGINEDNPITKFHVNFSSAFTEAVPANINGLMLTNSNATTNNGAAIYFSPVANDKGVSALWTGIMTDRSGGSQDINIKGYGLKNGTQTKMCVIDVDSITSYVNGNRKMWLNSLGLYVKDTVFVGSSTLKLYSTVDSGYYDASAHIWNIDGSEKMRLDESYLYVNGEAVVQNENNITYSSVRSFSTDIGKYPIISLRKSHQNVIGLTTTIDTENLGMVRFLGTDLSNNEDYGAYILAKQNGTAGTRLPTDLHFVTFTNSGANNPSILSTTGDWHFAYNVGIGITTPTQELDVNGDVNVTDSAFFTEILKQDTILKDYVREYGGTSISLGSDNQVPIMNSGGTDFEYGNFEWDGIRLYIEEGSDDNIFIGNSNTGNNINSKDNIGIGQTCFNNIANGAEKNIGIGDGAGLALTTGTHNLLIGFQSGSSVSTTDSSILIGSISSVNSSHKLYIDATNSTNPLIYGEFDNDSLKFTANVYITGSLWVDGTFPSDFVFNKNYDLPEINLYTNKAKKLNHLPEFENRDRRNIGQYISGLEEALEKQVLYNQNQQILIDDLIKRLEILENKKPGY